MSLSVNSPLAALAHPTEDANTALIASSTRATPNMEQAHQLRRWINTVNIAEELDQTELGEIGMKVQREYELDDQTRSDWKVRYAAWMERALQIAQPKTYPWPNASNVLFPLMTTASVQFAARAYPAIVQGRNVVKGVVIGDDKDDAKKNRSDRVGGYMSWQLLDDMPDWEPGMDMLCHVLPIVGCMFKKVYFDPGMQRNVSEVISALKICVNYNAKSFDRLPRITEEIELYPIEIEERVRSGVFLDHDYALEAMTNAADMDAPVEFLEQHRRLDLDGDGYAEPYIVTVLRETGRVARIVAGYDMEGVTFGPDHVIRRIKPVSYYEKFDFIPNPDGGIYGIGFGHLLYPINEAINSTLNQMLDAGHLANTGGGFIGRGVSMSAGSVRFQPGEYKQVNSTGADLKSNIVPLPFPGPNAVLFQLLGFLVDAGKDVAAVKDILMGNQPAGNVPATTVLALIEQGMQVFSAIYKRIHRALKGEYAKLYRLNRLYMDDTAKFRMGDQWKDVARSDFAEGAGVEPVSDPTMVSDMQRLGRGQFLLQLKDDPRINGVNVLKRVFGYAQIENADDLLIENPPAQPPDPQLVLGQHDLALRQAHEVEEARRKRERDAVMNVKDATQSYLNLANALKVSGETEQGWITHQMQVLQHAIDNWGDGESTGAGAVDGSTGADGSGGGAQPAGIPAMASPPGIPPLPQIPSGLPS